jgi:hypothetical protein
MNHGWLLWVHQGPREISTGHSDSAAPILKSCWKLQRMNTATAQLLQKNVRHQVPHTSYFSIAASNFLPINSQNLFCGIARIDSSGGKYFSSSMSSGVVDSASTKAFSKISSMIGSSSPVLAGGPALSPVSPSSLKNVDPALQSISLSLSTSVPMYSRSSSSRRRRSNSPSKERRSDYWRHKEREVRTQRQP